MTPVTDSRASYCCPTWSSATVVPGQPAHADAVDDRALHRQAQQTVPPDYPRWWQMPRTLKDAACGFVASGAMATATVMTGLLAAEAERSPEHQLESGPLMFLSFVFGVFTVASTLLTERVVGRTYESEREDLRERRAQVPTATAQAQDAVATPVNEETPV